MKYDAGWKRKTVIITMEADKYMTSNKKQPPGQGSLDLLKSLREMRRDPHEYLLKTYQAFGDCVFIDVPGNPAYFINHPDDVQHVLQMNHRNYDKNTFQYQALAKITGDGLLTNNGGEGWLQKRRVAQPAFSTKALEKIVPIVVEAVEAMMTGWRENANTSGLIDIDREMMNCALDVVAKALFGADLSDQAYLLTGAVMEALDFLIFQTRSLMMVPQWLPISQNRKYKDAMVTIEGVVNELIDQRSHNAPGDDLLGMLYSAVDEDGKPIFSRQEIRDEVVTLLIAGHETVASSLTWSWFLLAQQPEAFRALCDEARSVLAGHSPTYDDLAKLEITRQIYDEALRLYPPAWLITRRAIGADTVGGYAIPAGAVMVISPYCMHRRDDLWPQPGKFDPGRFTKEGSQGRHRFGFIPFGGGPRLCIGNRFAYIEAVTILAMVASQYELHLPPDAAVEVEALVTMRPKGGLPMKVTQSTPSYLPAGPPK